MRHFVFVIILFVCVKLYTQKTENLIIETFQSFFPLAYREVRITGLPYFPRFRWQIKIFLSNVLELRDKQNRDESLDNEKRAEILLYRHFLQVMNSFLVPEHMFSVVKKIHIDGQKNTMQIFRKSAYNFVPDDIFRIINSYAEVMPHKEEIYPARHSLLPSKAHFSFLMTPLKDEKLIVILKEYETSSEYHDAKKASNFSQLYTMISYCKKHGKYFFAGII